MLAPTEAGGSGGVVAAIAKLSVGREAYYTRALATDHQQYLSGHGESPGRCGGWTPSLPDPCSHSCMPVMLALMLVVLWRRSQYMR